MYCNRRFAIAVLMVGDVICMSYFIIINLVNYTKYHERDDFIIQSRQSYENYTIGYYITTPDFNTLECSNGSLFSFDVRNIYIYVVCKQCAWQNRLFENIFLITIMINCLTMFLDVLISCKRCLNKSSDSSSIGVDNCGYSNIRAFASMIMMKVVRQASFLIPTYFIGLFDYDRPCLSYRSYWSLVHLQHPGISLLLTVWSIACLIVSMWFFLSQGKTCQKSFCLPCGLYIVLFIPTIAYGSSVWFTSVFEKKLQRNAIVTVVGFVIHFLLFLFNSIFDGMND